jgi:protein O-mannosyl-transferase
MSRTVSNNSRFTELAAKLPALLLVVGAALAAYHNSFKGVFLFDDVGSISENSTIRRLWPLGPVLTKAEFATVVSRPLLNFSLAANYALGGTNPIGYHVVNLAVHVLAGLTLFGVLRRTFRLPSLQGHLVGRAPTGLALAATLLWTVHPLQTESVTYVCQRAESLAGLFYLLVFYCVLRAIDSSRPRWWYSLAVLACWLGVCTKETLVTAPVLLLAFDRIFLTNSWRTLLQTRRGFYAGLMASWILLAVLVVNSGGRQNSAGFGRGMAVWEYACTQPYYIVRYLAQAFWPDSLVLDYGMYVAERPAEIVPYALMIGGLLAATLWSLRVNPKVGYCGLWFFGTLAPTSSFVPLVRQTGAEHRVYLALAGLIVLVVMAGYALLNRIARNDERGQRDTAYVVVGMLVAVLGWLSVRRNDDYRSELAIWTDTVAKRPQNLRAQTNLGVALFSAGRTAEAFPHLELATHLKPDSPEPHNNLGVFLNGMEEWARAVEEFQKALRLRWDYPEALSNLGFALTQLARYEEAEHYLLEVVRLEPDFAKAQYCLGNLYVHMNRLEDAKSRYALAIQADPDLAEAHYDFGRVLAEVNRPEEAIEHLRVAVRLRPSLANSYLLLARLQSRQGRIAEAIATLESGLSTNAPNPVIANEYAWLLVTCPVAELRNAPQAIQIGEELVKATGRRAPQPLDTLAAAYAEAGRFDEAIHVARQAELLAEDQKRTELSVAIAARIALYENHQPYRLAYP